MHFTSLALIDELTIKSTILHNNSGLLYKQSRPGAKNWIEIDAVMNET